MQRQSCPPLEKWRMLTSPSRVYASALLDSTRWNDLAFRPDDIFVCTYQKAGTTWMQNIVLHLIFQDLKVRNIHAVSPFLELRRMPLAAIQEILEPQRHRRCIKSHVALDGITFSSEASYIVVGRDPRDVAMSLWNFYSNFTEAHFGPPDEPGIAPMPPPPDDFHEFWQSWITRGTFPWETDGYPFWSCFHHAQAWWQARQRPNVHFVHFNDLLSDLEGEVDRLTEFLGIACADETKRGILDLVSFAAMKRDGAKLHELAEKGLRGGAATFFHKGTNGRWRDALTPGELDQYEQAAGAVMEPACKAWMETGGRVSA
jgi:aryl sulfotransferase